MRPLAPPPRQVPISLRVAALFNLTGLIGWGVIGFGSIFFWTFGRNADLSFITFRGELKQAAARVVKVEPTSASENDVRIVANHYEYSVAGKPFQGVAYATGQGLSVGETVNVDYKPGAPEESRIPGMRRGMFGPFVLFILIFPLIGAGLAAGGFVWGRRRAQLLGSGMFTFGTLKEKNPTNMTVNKMPVWELVFEFMARDGRRYEAKARTSQTARLEDDHQEPLLYDADDPSRAVLLDDAPARPQLDERGELVGRPMALARLIVPALVIGGNVAVAMLV